MLLAEQNKQTNKQAEKQLKKKHQTNKEMKQNKDISEKVRMFLAIIKCIMFC